MRELILSAPYLDPSQRNKRSADYLVVQRTSFGAVIHRFTSRDDADAWRDERLATLDQEREQAARRCEA